MKTSVFIPNILHKLLQRLSLERGTTMAELIAQAVRQTYVPGNHSHKSEKVTALARLRGTLKGHSSASQISSLKQMWNNKR